jgi:hypothetical protein
VQRERGTEYPDIWTKYEKVILESLVDTIDAKNLAIITHQFSHAGKGSMEFWSTMNLLFAKAFT